MSTQDSRNVRNTVSTRGLHAQVQPIPFPAAGGYEIHVSGGIPPYVYTPEASPPNPPGVVIIAGDPVMVEVPPGTPSGTTVVVTVSDSSVPPKTVVTTNQVA